jgi:hypothetical protein
MGSVNSQLSRVNGFGSSIALGHGTDRLKQASLQPLRFEFGKRSSGAIGQSGARSKGGRSKGKDKTAPKASLGVLSPVAGGSSTYEFAVTYTDNKAVKASSIDNNDIRVLGSNGYNQLAKQLAIVSSGKGKSFKVTYQIVSPSRIWAATDNGSYNIALQARQVKDSSGNFAAAQGLGAFSLTVPSHIITPPVGLDTIAPTASLKADKLVTSGGSTYDFTVTYTDNVAIDASTIDSNDLTVVDSKGSIQTVEKVSISGSGNSYTATYRLKAPGGTWNRADNGLYNIVVQPNQIKDVNGNSVVSSTVGAFSTDVPLRSTTRSGSSNTSNSATDFTLDIDTSAEIVQKFTFTYIERVPDVDPVTHVTQLKETPYKETLTPVGKIITFNSVEELFSPPVTGVPSTSGSYGGAIFESNVRSSFANSDLIYLARFNDYSRHEGSNNKFNVLVFGVKTSNPDRSNTLDLLNIALNGEDKNTTIDNNKVVYGSYEEAFYIEGLK